MTDYKQLCAELVDSIELLLEMRPVKARPLKITEERLHRARAALTEPDLDPFDVVQRHLDNLAGDEEMVIYRWSDGCWSIDHTNPSNSVKLGESNGEYESGGSSLKEAVINLEAILPSHLLT